MDIGLFPHLDEQLGKARCALDLYRRAERLPRGNSREFHHVEFALQILEEMLTSAALTRSERDLRDNIAQILIDPDKITTIAREVEQKLYVRGKRPIPPAHPQRQTFDLIEGGIAVGVLEKVAAKVTDILEVFAPNY